MTLHRVSSRPRLCSFDSFDASSDANIVMEDSFVVDVLSLKRKRHLIPCEQDVSNDCETHSNEILWSLPEDPQQLILEFLDVESTRAVSQVNRFYRQWIQTNTPLWRLHLLRQWPHLITNENKQDPVNVESNLVNHFHHGTETPPLNYVNLLKLAAETPSGVDASLLHQGNRRVLRHRVIEDTDTSHLKLILHQGKHAVQYTGRIGQGDRCIRSDMPLPRCTYHQEHCRRSLFPLRHQHRNRPYWKPFVAPYYVKEKLLDLTPRFVAYFEVTLTKEERSTRDTHISNHQNNSNAIIPPECIAIGLGTRDFSYYSRMPGWDRLSFGYHSDDGGIFHGKGHMLRNYGPSGGFGAGDTVGLGLDYQKQAIFYTLNGVFLGYAFEHLDMNVLQQPLYPVIGMDTHCLVKCDFMGPFRFDLHGHLCERRRSMDNKTG